MYLEYLDASRWRRRLWFLAGWSRCAGAGGTCWQRCCCDAISWSACSSRQIWARPGRSSRTCGSGCQQPRGSSRPALCCHALDYSRARSSHLMAAVLDTASNLLGLLSRSDAAQHRASCRPYPPIGCSSAGVREVWSLSHICVPSSWRGARRRCSGPDAASACVAHSRNASSVPVSSTHCFLWKSKQNLRLEGNHSIEWQTQTTARSTIIIFKYSVSWWWNSSLFQYGLECARHSVYWIGSYWYHSKYDAKSY